MHSAAVGSSFELPLQHNEDSGMGESCSGSSTASRDSTEGAAGPTDFASMNDNGGGLMTQKLSRELASMHIKRRENRAKKGDFGTTKEEDGGVEVLFDEDDENARDCDSSFSMMPPPALPAARRVLGDIKNGRVESPVSSKRFSRNDTMPMMSSNSTGGLRNRKRGNRSPRRFASPFGSDVSGKRWRVAESIDEHSESASTSYLPRTHSMELEGKTSRTFYRVQSTSVLEMGSHHDDDGLPQPLEVSYALPSALERADSDAYRRICAQTLSQLMQAMGEAFEKSYALIDCRYPYEFEGGHIKGATNVFDPQHIDAHFFSKTTSLLKAGRGEEERENEEKKRIPIFYCEFSQKRGPSMALAVRALDRLRNTWPRVDHAEMYVLNGGYKGFHENATKNGFGELCAPFSYTQMEDPAYKAQMDKFRFHKSRNLLSFTGTVSRLPQPSAMESRFARQAAQSSPISVQRRASRRALVFHDDREPSASSPCSPVRPSLDRLPNPQFS